MHDIVTVLIGLGCFVAVLVILIIGMAIFGSKQDGTGS